MTHDQVRAVVQGEFRIRIYEHGELVDESISANLVVAGITPVLAHALGGDVVSPVGLLGVGTSAAAAAPGDVAPLADQVVVPIAAVSYPAPGSEECIEYNGCEWAGQFSALPSKMPESWVQANNIASVHSKDFAAYKLKTLRLRQGTKQIDVKVYDMCADSDCSGCCTKNSSSTGFLIDIEKYTAARFGTKSGVVEWTCLDC